MSKSMDQFSLDWKSFLIAWIWYFGVLLVLLLVTCWGVWDHLLLIFPSLSYFLEIWIGAYYMHMLIDIGLKGSDRLSSTIGHSWLLILCMITFSCYFSSTVIPVSFSFSLSIFCSIHSLLFSLLFLCWSAVGLFSLFCLYAGLLLGSLWIHSLIEFS